MPTIVARKSDEGPAYWFLGGLYEVLVTGEETDDDLTMMRISIPAGGAAPPHRHPDGPEVVHVLSGEITYHLDGDDVIGGPGSTFHVPAGLPEWFEANEDTTLLVTYRPGGIDRFFDRMGEPAATRTVPPPPTTPPDFAAIAAAGREFGLEILPPSD